LAAAAARECLQVCAAVIDTTRSAPSTAIRRDDGTIGLIIGGLAGGLLGNTIAPGGGAGALLGRSIDRNGSSVRCR
jgi:outer membrane lipoprotein SlyB